MRLTGKNLINGEWMAVSKDVFEVKDPESGEILEGRFYEATHDEVDKAAKNAEAAFPIYSSKTPDERADFLEQIGTFIFELGDVLIERAMAETALPSGRLIGERGRTINQLNLFAELIREGSWVDARIDTARPDRSPVPKPDIRHMLVALGPVGVFGASNFPLAFSVAGGDTASALAAGCPVVVKGHPAHPGTCELVASAIAKAAKKCNMPAGVFSLLQGRSHRVGAAIVNHPNISAIGFTGSYSGGKALFDLANQRPHPIPVFAEMGSINPVFILPEALKNRGQEIASGLAASVTLGVGQFCTNPGLVILPQEEGKEDFRKTLAESIRRTTGGTMLHEGIKETYASRIKEVEELGITSLAEGKKSDSNCGTSARIFNTTYSEFQKHSNLKDEIFGPASVIIDTPHKEMIFEIAKQMEGHLTATIHGTEEDLKEYAGLIRILQRKVGRILINGYPTGVEVCASMVHGGPFPATTNASSTSVGTNAIKRFARPVCFQNFNSFLLPVELKDENSRNIWRMIDGTLTKQSLPL